jgi:hypothetical protein
LLIVEAFPNLAADPLLLPFLRGFEAMPTGDKPIAAPRALAHNDGLQLPLRLHALGDCVSVVGSEFPMVITRDRNAD